MIFFIIFGIKKHPQKMQYLEYKISVASAEQSEIVMADLAEIGFDSFTDYETGLGTMGAYIASNEHVKHAKDIENYLHELPHTVTEIEPENWNALWESNFEPIDVGGRCYIRAPFHEPMAGVEHEVVIMPKMSFGTGHHPTTHLMVEAVLSMELEGFRGLDMGSGTGILAILAAKRGAVHVDAIDIDDWATENCNENAELNGVQDRVRALLGDASLLDSSSSLIGGGQAYDFVLANINRNILLRDMPSYVSLLANGGVIVFSGILEFDVPDIEGRAVELGLTIISREVRQGWARIIAKK